MKPYIKNFKLPRVSYRRPNSTADPIKNYILLLLILMLLSAFVLGSCSTLDTKRDHVKTESVHRSHAHTHTD
jgi:hypothetical protein